MKSNIVIIGEDSEINKSVGTQLAVLLEINYLDFNDYCDYINILSRDEIVKQYGKRKYNELQKEALPHMCGFCDSVIGFDSKMSRLPSVHKLLNDSAYIICIASEQSEKYKKHTHIWMDLNLGSVENILDEIVKKLGEL